MTWSESRRLILGILILGSMTGMIGCKMSSEPPLLSAAELVQQIRSGQAPDIVDVREPEELQGPLGALPGVVNIPLSVFDQRFGEIRKDRRVALICRSGNRSGKAYQFLKSQGYTRTQNVVGGMAAVRSAEQP